MSKYSDFLTEQLKDPALKAEYDALEPEFSVIQAMIDARKAAGLTQKQLADKTGIAQSDISKLEKAPDGKNESFFYTYTAAGLPLASALQKAVEKAAHDLPVPKMMTYQRPDGETVEFVRPVHEFIAMHGENCFFQLIMF